MITYKYKTDTFTSESMIIGGGGGGVEEGKTSDSQYLEADGANLGAGLLKILKRF